MKHACYTQDFHFGATTNIFNAANSSGINRIDLVSDCFSSSRIFFFFTFIQVPSLLFRSSHTENRLRAFIIHRATGKFDESNSSWRKGRTSKKKNNVKIN